jgi:hypothetical protein
VKRLEKTLTLAAGLMIAAACFPLVLLGAGMQDWVAETAAKAGNGPITHYGKAAVIIYLALCLIGATLGGWWALQPDRRAPGKNSISTLPPAA